MKRKLLIIAAVVIVVTLALTALLTSEAGLQWALARVAALVPGELRVQTLDGELLGPIHARGLVYRDARTELHIGELVLDWQPGALLRATWHITRLDLDDVQLHRRSPPASAAPAPRLSLPLAVELDAVRLTHAALTLDEADTVTQVRAELSGSGHDTRVRLTQFTIETEHYSVAAAGQIDLAPPYPVDLDLRWSVRVPTLAPIAGHGWLRGDSRRLATEQQLAPPWGARLNASASDVLGATSWNATLATADLDPAAWGHGWPAALLRAHIEAQGDRRQLTARGRVGFTRAGRTLDGDVRIRAADTGVTL